ncbi:LysR substrate-binding domain-containing protein [Tepidamorphus sp. 3E244]|uniref:LysR substrate-binding domain-containing protein n=1 Tax=Tepidamorphus sp. 3E244 TaxID=3385498 RepID=UPI0038FC4D8E
MSLKQLRYLDAVAHEGHFGRAAARAGVSQPALSVQIREMEARLGVQLIERHPGGGRLTDAGREIAARAARILTDIREIEDFARSRGEGFAGPLRLGIIPSVAPFLLPRLLPRITIAFPKLELVLRETITDNLTRELLEGDLDLMIASLPLSHPQIEHRVAYNEAFLLVAAGDDTPQDAPLPLHALTGERVLLLEDGHCLRDQVLQACGTSLEPERRAGGGATSLSTLVELVANGQGVTLVPELYGSNVCAGESRVRVTRFADPQPERRVALAWRRTHPLAARFEEMRDLVSACITD